MGGDRNVATALSVCRTRHTDALRHYDQEARRARRFPPPATGARPARSRHSHFDVKDVPVNVFNDEVARELQEVVQRIERDTPRAIVFRSAKLSGFLAGADVRQIRRLKSEDEVRSVLTAGQQLFDRIEQLAVPDHRGDPRSVPGRGSRVRAGLPPSRGSR